MKKFISLLMTVAMMISTASAVFAADCNYTLAASSTSVTPGDTITFTLKLDSNPGMAYFKNIINFDETTFSRVPYLYEVIEDEEVVETIEYDVYSTWGSITCNDAQDNKTIMVWSNSSNKTSKTVLKINYQVAEDAINGDYTFEALAEEVLNASGAAVDVASATTTITVTGGKEPTPPVEDKKEATKAEEEKANAVVDGLYTQGFKATVTPNDQIVSEVKVVLSATKAAKTAEPIVWTAPVEGFASFEFAVNVLNVPEGETVTAAWDMTAAFAE